MKLYKKIKNCNKGSSIVTVVIVMVVLIMLGGAVTIVSMSTLNNNSADSSNNEAYYSAESAANSAVEHLKYIVVSYYEAMKAATPTQYMMMYTSFEPSIVYNAQTTFVEPDLDNNTTTTTFSSGTYDSVNDVCEFDITCISLTPDNAKYRVDAKVFVKKIDISIEGGALNIPANAAIITGGLMDLDYDSGIGVIGGDVIVGGITYESLKKNSVPYNIVGGVLYENPSIGDMINDPFVYESYENPVITAPDIYAATEMTIQSIPVDPIEILSAPGVKLNLSCTINDGVVHSQGNLEIINGQYGADIYADGNMVINSSVINGDLYCRGNIYITSTTMRGNIYCDGNVYWTSGKSDGNIIAGGNVTIESASSVCNVISKGNVNLKSVGVKAGLIFASGDVSIGTCSVTAVIYTTGHFITTGSWHLKGAIIGKGDFYFSNEGSNMQMQYDPEFVQQILDEVNSTIFDGEGTPPTLDSSIFVMEKITPIGRVN